MMNADENAAILRRAYAAFNSGDMDTLIETFDESAVWHLPGRSAMASDYQGRDATLAYFGKLAQETGGTSRRRGPRSWHPAQRRGPERQAPGCRQLHRLPVQGRQDR
jgi:ketosteroid isomerase-like protein